ncbi:MAG TPA: DUF2298 domain-containing protein, partial [Chloroflexota bacterium]|nr:DUF2298 domain-containing protein [Chloroflexota bacterium]
MNTAQAPSAYPSSFFQFNTTMARAAVVVVCVIAAFFRLYDLNWDSNQHLHPDERHIVMVTMDRVNLPWPNIQDANLGDPKRSTINPRSADPATGQARSFAYGTLPLYLLKATGAAVATVWEPARGIDGLTLVGRVWSALFDLGTVLLVFLIGRRLYGRWAGLLAAALVSTTVLHVQLAHFYAVETALVFFLIATVYLGLRVMERPSGVRVLAMGIAAGLAMACKVSAAPILIACAVACFAGWQRDARPQRMQISALGAPLAATIWAGLAALAVFFAFHPYVLLDPQPFLKDIGYESGMVRGETVPPYTIQYLRTDPGWYHLRNLLLWTAGPYLGLTLVLSLPYLLGRIALFRRWEEVLLAAWLLPYLAITMSFQVKFARYLLPVIPLLAVAAAGMLVAIVVAGRQLSRGKRLLAWTPMALVLAGAILQTVAFLGVYSGDHTRVVASRWIYDSVPRGAAIATEHWDDGLPLRLPEFADREGSFRNITLPMYDVDTPRKRAELIRSLSQADYLVLSSNRLYGSIPRVPEVYPMATAYYRGLFDGSLGFDLAAQFTSYPSIGPLRFVDDAADESFTVYDHPKVLVFKKGPAYSEAGVKDLLESVPLDRLATIKEVQAPDRNRLMLSDQARAAQERSGTWSDLYDRTGLSNAFPTLSWWLALELLGLLALPLAWRLFARLGDRGYGLSKILGLLLVSYVAWLLASLRVHPFGASAVLIGMLFVALLSTVAVWGQWPRFRAELSSRGSLILLSEAVFVAAFALFWFIRTHNPDLWHLYHGGEKPMEFAYLNAVAKSSYFPPYDPWLAGGYINYYYFGYVMVASLIRLTGILPAVAFNLAIASVFALTAGGLFSFGLNYWVARIGGVVRVRTAAVAGGMAALFVLIAGNIDGLTQLLEALWKHGSLQVKSNIPGLAGLLKAGSGLWNMLSTGAGLPPLDFWRSTRLISPEQPTPVTEFPFFTFLYGDLHPHMMSMPLAVLALGLVLSIVLSAHYGGTDTPSTPASTWVGLVLL